MRPRSRFDFFAPVRATMLVLVTLTASVAQAFAQENTCTTHQMAKLRMVTQAEISPDGTRVAYVLSVPRTPLKEDDGPAWAELHVVTSDGASRPFVTGQVTVSAVS